MATAVRPESDSGAFPIRRTSAVPLSHPAPTRRRLDHVDLLRGLVMVIMVLDHVRAFFTNAHFDPDRPDPHRPGAVRHPVDHPLLRPGVRLPRRRQRLDGRHPAHPGELSRFLLTRGLWLVLLEFTVITFGWYFTTDWRSAWSRR